MMRNFRPVIVGLCAFLVAAHGARVLAHGGATGIVKQRMDVMESMGDAMKALTAVIRGLEPYDAARVRVFARDIGKHGGANLIDLFPAGSLQQPSEALPAIWTDWERFGALAWQLTIKASNLERSADLARDGTVGKPLLKQPAGLAFRQLAQTCSSCHQDFRRKK